MERRSFTKGLAALPLMLVPMLTGAVGRPAQAQAGWTPEPLPDLAVLQAAIMSQLAMPNCRETGGFGRSHSLSFDHRLVDGSDADKFMAHVKKGLQEFDESGL